jgi:hypothetical protein
MRGCTVSTPNIAIEHYDPSFHRIGACPSPDATPFVMAVYDRYGMRLFTDTRAHVCSSDPRWEAAAKATAEYWPGNQVHMWLDTSLAPTEHLRDMPPSDASWPKGMGR